MCHIIVLICIPLCCLNLVSFKMTYFNPLTPIITNQWDFRLPTDITIIWLLWRVFPSQSLCNLGYAMMGTYLLSSRYLTCITHAIVIPRTYSHNYLWQGLSWTRLDGINFVLADSSKYVRRRLIRWCDNTARSNYLRSCGGCCFQQIQLADTSEIVSGSDRTDVRTPDMAIVSNISITWDFKANLLCKVGYWALPG